MHIRNLGLIAALVATPCFAGQQTIDITAIGPVPIGPPRPVRGATDEARTEYFVDQLQEISGATRGGRVASGQHLYPLLRAQGEVMWKVLPEARVQPGNRSLWFVEIQIGRPSEQGRRFELQMVRTQGPLASGPIPAEILRQEVRAASPILRLVRRRDRAEVWISSINGKAVLREDNEILDVAYQSPIEAQSRNLPPLARIAVAIQPTQPWTDRWWVMEDTFAESYGVITGHFGIRYFHNHHQFRVVAFATRNMPPAAVPIAPEQWMRYERDFLAQSPPITVWRWESETRITHVNAASVSAYLVMLADGQAQVRGTIRRPFGPAEKLWLLCVPIAGDPWVAGWTSVWQPGGRWVIHAAALGRSTERRGVDVVAVVSPDDPTKLPAGVLRNWVHDSAERSMNRLRIRVAGSPREPAMGQ